MPNLLRSEETECPYCGEQITLTIDCSVEHQDYIEDCSVCCRPISLGVSVENDHVQITCRHENE